MFKRGGKNQEKMPSKYSQTSSPSLFHRWMFYLEAFNRKEEIFMVQRLLQFTVALLNPLPGAGGNGLSLGLGGSLRIYYSQKISVAI